MKKKIVYINLTLIIFSILNIKIVAMDVQCCKKRFEEIIFCRPMVNLLTKDEGSKLEKLMLLARRLKTEGEVQEEHRLAEEEFLLMANSSEKKSHFCKSLVYSLVLLSLQDRSKDLSDWAKLHLVRVLKFNDEVDEKIFSKIRIKILDDLIFFADKKTCNNTLAYAYYDRADFYKKQLKLLKKTRKDSLVNCKDEKKRLEDEHLFKKIFVDYGSSIKFLKEIMSPDSLAYKSCVYNYREIFAESCTECVKYLDKFIKNSNFITGLEEQESCKKLKLIMEERLKEVIKFTENNECCFDSESFAVMSIYRAASFVQLVDLYRDYKDLFKDKEKIICELLKEVRKALKSQEITVRKLCNRGCLIKKIKFISNGLKKHSKINLN